MYRAKVYETESDKLIATLSVSLFTEKRKPDEMNDHIMVKSIITEKNALEVAKLIVDTIRENPEFSSDLNYKFYFANYSGAVLSIQFSGENMNDRMYEELVYHVALGVAECMIAHFEKVYHRLYSYVNARLTVPYYIYADVAMTKRQEIKNNNAMTTYTLEEM